MQVSQKAIEQLLAGLSEPGTPGATIENGARALVEAAKSQADLEALLETRGGRTIDAARGIVRDYVRSTQKSAPAATTSPLAMQMTAKSGRAAELRDDEPHHHQAFDQAISSLGADQKATCRTLGIVSLSTLQFVHQMRTGLHRAQAKLVEALFLKTCSCACHPDQKPPRDPVRTPKVDIAGYGEFRAPTPAPPRDPLFIGMSDVIAGATLEIRNRSEGIDEKQIQPWIPLPVETTGARAEDGRMHVAIGPSALAQMKLDAWDQFEIRQRLPDGSVSDPVLPNLGTERSGYQLPSKWDEVPVVDVGQVDVPPRAIFRPFPDTALVELNPKALTTKFHPSQNGPGTFRVSAAVRAGEPFANFVEPRAQVFLKNLVTGEKTKPVEVQPDGTFEVEIDGDTTDAFQMHVYDQGRAEEDVDNHRILTFARAGSSPIVAYCPEQSLPAATDLIMETLSAARGRLLIDRGITPGSVVAVTDLSTNSKTIAVADRAGSLEVPVEAKQGKVFEIRVDNPFVHGRNEKAPDGSSRTVRVQVKKGGQLNPVATEQFPPSGTTGHVEPAKLDDRTFDPNRDVTFVPTKLDYLRNSHGVRSGGLKIDLEPSTPLRAEGGIQTRAVILHRSGSKLQIVMEPLLERAVGQPEGGGNQFSSTFGSLYTGGQNHGLQARFRAENFPNSYLEHLDVEVVRPDGSLIGTAELRPDEVRLTSRGEVPQSWAFSNFEKAEGVVPLLDMNGLSPADRTPPYVRAHAWIEPNKKYAVGASLSKEELEAFSGGEVSGKMKLQLDLFAEAQEGGYDLSEVAAIEVVNLSDDPAGFATKDGIETVKINEEKGIERGSIALSLAATKRLDIHNDDLIQIRAVMNDGSTTLASDPTKIQTPAKPRTLTRKGDFISSGVVTRWEQIPIGKTYEGRTTVYDKGEPKTTEMVMAPPPARKARAWKDSVKFSTNRDGNVEMTWAPGGVQLNESFGFSHYSTQNPYGSSELYATTSDTLHAPGAGERPRLVFEPPAATGVIVIHRGNERVVYPPKMAKDARVQALFE